VIVVGVERHHEGVVVVVRLVAAQHRGDDAIRLPVVADRRDVDRLIVVDDADLGALGDRATFVGLGLDELRQHDGFGPDEVVEHPIDARRLADPGGDEFEAQVGFGETGGRRLALRQGREGTLQHQRGDGETDEAADSHGRRCRGRSGERPGRLPRPSRPR